MRTYFFFAVKAEICFSEREPQLISPRNKAVGKGKHFNLSKPGNAWETSQR